MGLSERFLARFANTSGKESGRKLDFFTESVKSFKRLLQHDRGLPNRLRRALESAYIMGTAHEVYFTCPNNQAGRKAEWLSFSCNFSVHKYVPKDPSVNSNEELPFK